MSTEKEESVELFYKEGSSDKVYKASLERKDEGWVVNFSYGRRGNVNNNGTKTEVPVDYEIAHKIYEKLVGEKTKKGYVPDPSGQVFQ